MGCRQNVGSARCDIHATLVPDGGEAAGLSAMPCTARMLLLLMRLVDRCNPLHDDFQLMVEMEILCWLLNAVIFPCFSKIQTPRPRQNR